MRDLFLAGVVILLCVLALVRPRIGMLGYTWFALMRPDILAWTPSDRPYSLALALSTLIGSLPHIMRFGVWFTNPISRWLLVFLVPITVSTTGALQPALSWQPWNLFIRIVAMALLIVVFVETERNLQTLIILIAVSLGFLGLKLAVYGFAVGEAQYMDDYTGTMLSDNNMLALALAMVAPLCWYGRFMSRLLYVRLALFALTFGCIGGVVMTNSRGGAVSLGVGLLMVAARSKRRFITICALIPCLVPAVYVAGNAYLKRLSSITADEEIADASIRSRLNHRRAAYAMWKDYPYFGVGFGMNNYARLAPRYLGYEDNHVAHNTYFQILADDGIFAFLIYLRLLFGTIISLHISANRVKVSRPGKEIYPYAIQTSLVTFAVGSYFLSRDYYDLLYILFMAAAAWRVVERTDAFMERDTFENTITDERVAIELSAAVSGSA